MRLGLFGGTFDPPHTGHLLVAQDAALALGLDRVVFVPAALPPHKLDVPLTPARMRVRMLELAIEGDARFTIDTLELDRPGPSYTVDTLRELGRRCPGDWTLLIGADQFAEFQSWRQPDEILRIASVAVLERGGAATDAERNAAVAPITAQIRPGVERVSVTRVDVSSTLVRARVAAGLSIRYLVPPAVESFIRTAGLYVRNGTSRAG